MNSGLNKFVFLIVVSWQITAHAVAKMPVQTYESFRSEPQGTFRLKLAKLKDYLSSSQNVHSCAPLSSDSGVNTTFKVTYKNGLQGIAKYHVTQQPDGSFKQEQFDLDKVNRELNAFVIATDLGLRAVAPIVAMTHANNACPGVLDQAQLVISYFIIGSTHVTTSTDLTFFNQEKKKYDWFHFLVLDCDHNTHNILKAADGTSYLFDYDWAFSYRNEIQSIVHTQKGYETWCDEYLSLLPSKTANRKTKEICLMFPSALNTDRVLQKIKAYGDGNFPSGFRPMDEAREKTFRARSKYIARNLEKCGAQPAKKPRPRQKR